MPDYPDIEKAALAKLIKQVAVEMQELGGFTIVVRPEHTLSFVGIIAAGTATTGDTPAALIGQDVVRKIYNQCIKEGKLLSAELIKISAPGLQLNGENDA